jgi:hypothetical protein
MDDRPRFKHPGTFVRRLGSGAYGQVVEIEYQGKRCALKYGNDKSIAQEAKILEKIGAHPNVVRVLESGEHKEDDNDYYTTWWMVMEKFDESLIASFRAEKIKAHHIKTMFRHVLEALIYIQSKGFNHQDCHMGNIGIKWDTPTQPRFILCDFGMSVCYLEEDGTLLDTPNIHNDLDRFFKVVRRYLPYPDSVPRELERKMLDLMSQAVSKYRPRILAESLEMVSEEMVQKAIGTAVEKNKRDSLQLILLFKARQTGQTLASVCRALLESEKKVPTGTFLACPLDPLMAMIEWAGYADNPEIKHVVSKENSWVIRRQVQGPLPELLQRVLSM